jgi:hypothetical protein
MSRAKRARETLSVTPDLASPGKIAVVGRSRRSVLPAPRVLEIESSHASMSTTPGNGARWLTTARALTG